MGVETRGVGSLYAGTAVGLMMSFSRIGFVVSPPIGNSLAAIHPGLPFVFWAGLALMAFICALFLRETGHRKAAGNREEYYKPPQEIRVNDG
jgi:MFS family permease